MSADDVAAHSFYRSLQEAAAEQRARLSDPHHLRPVLRLLLPERFALVRGQVVSSNPKLRLSDPQEALILDTGRNAPFLTGARGPFPIELIAATVIFLPMLDEAHLPRLADALLPLRRMARRGRYYAGYVPVKKPNGKSLAALREHRIDTPPRTYAIVRSATWDKPDSISRELKDQLQRDEDLHLDGLLLLDRDWFFHQPDNKHRIECAAEDGFLRFAEKLLVDLDEAETGPVSLARYAPKA